jgi:bacterioferritin (cytochrome b1)
LDFVLALGYKGEMIKNYFCHYELMNNDVTIELGRPESMRIHHAHDEAGWKVTLADTGEKSLKGARLKKVEQYLLHAFLQFNSSFEIVWASKYQHLNNELMIKKVFPYFEPKEHLITSFWIKRKI